MALPPSGTITVSAVAAEFGGSAPHSLSEYYRGGGLVPDITANSNVPTSGTIKLSNFYGAQNALWSTTMTAGFIQIPDPFGPTITVSGFNDIDFTTGSLSDTTVDFYSGAACKGIYANDSGGAITLYFVVAGSQSNSGWTTMTIGSYGSFSRTAATYTLSGGNTFWNWSNQSHFSNGVNYSVSFV